MEKNLDFPPEFREVKNVVAIDFDGVIHDDYLGYHDGTIYGEMLPGAGECLKDIASKYKIVIFTAKARHDRPLVSGKDGIELVWEWLEKNGISRYVEEVTATKPRASLYIDDKALRFNSWTEMRQELSELGFL